MLTSGDGGKLSFSHLSLEGATCGTKDEGYTGYYKWACFRGAVAWGDAFVVLVPWASKQLVVLKHREARVPDVIVQTLTISPDDEDKCVEGQPCIHLPSQSFSNSEVHQSNVGWFGGGVAVGNSVYLAPAASLEVGVINFENGGPVFSTIEAAPGYNGAAAFEDKVFFAPGKIETPIGVLDTATNVFTTIKPDYPPFRKYPTNNKWSNHLYSGATAVGPWIFFAPLHADHVGVLHAQTHNFTTIDITTDSAENGITWDRTRPNRNIFSDAVTVGDRPFFVPYYGDDGRNETSYLSGPRYVAGGIGTLGCPPPPPPSNYVKTAEGQYCEDSTGYQDVTTEADCEAAASDLQIPWGNPWSGLNDHHYCLTDPARNKVFFNTAANAGHRNSNYASICRISRNDPA